MPAGFRPSSRSSPFLDLIGALYPTADDQILGLRVRPQLLNVRGFVHVVVALADVALGRALTPPSAGDIRAVTASLTLDFFERFAMVSGSR